MAPLPFLTLGALLEQGGDGVEDADEIPCTVWPAGGGNSNTGRNYDHVGEAHLDYADALVVSNRKLVVGGVTYAIVGAVPQPMVIPHVALRLRATRAGGGG